MKIKIQPVKIKDLKEYIILGFRDDTDMMEKYRTHTGDFDEQMRFNYQTILDMDNGENLSCYKVMSIEGKRKTPIGFCVFITIPSVMLYSFAINQEYRHKDVLTKWIGAMDRVMGTWYKVMIYAINTRARDFFMRNGFTKMTNYQEYNTITLQR